MAMIPKISMNTTTVLLGSGKARVIDGGIAG
jgi:hypothetical protein